MAINLSPNILKYRDHRWNLLYLENKISPDKYWRDQLVFMIAQAHTSSNQRRHTIRTRRFQKVKVGYDCLTNLRTTWELCYSRLDLEEKVSKDIRKSSRFQFLETFFASYFALSKSEYNTSVFLNRGVKEDLPLLRTLLAICSNSHEPCFWKVITPFILLA